MYNWKVHYSTLYVNEAGDTIYMVNTGQQGGRYGVKQLQNDILGSTNQYIKAETAWIVVLAPIGDYPSTAPVFEENEKMYPPVELPYGRDTGTGPGNSTISALLLCAHARTTHNDLGAYVPRHVRRRR